MTKSDILDMYRKGENHLNIAHTVYAYFHAIDGKYTITDALKLVEKILLESNKRP